MAPPLVRATDSSSGCITGNSNNQLELRQVESRLASSNNKLIDCGRSLKRQQHNKVGATNAKRNEPQLLNGVQHEDKMSWFTRNNANQQLTRSRKQKLKAFQWQTPNNGHDDDDGLRQQQQQRQQHHGCLPKSFRRTNTRSQWKILCLLLVGATICCHQQFFLQSVSCQSTEESPSTTTTTTQQPPTGPSTEQVDQSTTPTNSNSNETSPTQASGGLNVVSKLKPVNFTLVDEIFESSLSEDEVVKRWKNMDGQFQDGIRSILKLVFPQIVAISQDAKVSGDCSGGILKWILSLRNLRSWAIKMLDATGKPTAGIFEGSLTMFGNYRQCLSIRAPDEDEIEITDQFEEYFRGQFCVLHLKPWMPTKKPFYHLNSTIESLLRKNYKYYEKTLYDELAEIAIAFNFIDIRMDLCVPSTCTVADIQRVAELLSRKLEMRAKVMRCDTSPREPAAGSSPTSWVLANQWDRLATTSWLVLPLILVCLVLLCTILSALGLPRKRANNRLAALMKCLTVNEILRLRLIVPRSDETTMLAGQQDAPLATSNEPQRAGIAFVSDLLWTQRKPLPLYGLRNVFIFWFIIVQMTVELKYQYLRESLVLRNMLLSYWPFQIIINSTLLFDSIILMTAFTYSYSNLESTFKELVGYILDKYLRLVPSIIAVVALTIFTPLMAIESPVWKNFVEQQAEICKSTGYLNLFFLQNFISYEKICIPHTWLFCVEFQLVLISIPLIILLKKIFIHHEDSLIIEQSEKLNQLKPATSSTSDQFKSTLFKLVKSKAGLAGLAIIALGVLVNFLLVYLNQLPPSWFFTFPDVEQKNYYFGKYLSKTWTHLTSFFIGLFAGHLCRSTFQLNNLRLIRNRITESSSVSSSSPSSSPPSQHHRQQQQDNSNLTDSFGGYQSANSSQSIVSLAPNQSSRVESHSGSDAGCHKSSSTFSFNLLLSALVCMLAIIFSTYSWSTNEAPSALVAALYDSLSRLIWSLGLVIMMIQLCLPAGDTNDYTMMGQFFSHRAFIVLGRLSFLVYLMSPYVHTFVLAVEEQSMFPSLFLIFHVIVGNIVIIYLVAFVVSILIEQPIRLAFQLLIGQTTRSSASFCMPQQTTTICINKHQQNDSVDHAKARMNSYHVSGGNNQHTGGHDESGLPATMAPSH